MRNATTQILGVATLSLLLLACGTAQPAPSGEQPSRTMEPQAGGTFVMAVHSETPHMDPQQAGSGANLIHFGLIYSQLMRWPNDPAFSTDQVACDLCESWQQKDATTYVFTLRKGVKWHNLPPVNGRELVADDIVYSFTRLNKDDPKFRDARGVFNVIDKVEALDRHTVQFKLKTPFTLFVYHLGNMKRGPSIVAREAVEKDDSLLTTAVGTGPFVQVERNPKAKTVYRKNADYFKPGKPYLDEVHLVIMPDQDVRFAAFRAGQIQEPGYFLKQDQIDTLKARHPDLAYEGTPRGKPIIGVGFNVAKDPVKDVRVRRAIALALDHQEYVETLYSGAAVLTGWISAAQPELGLSPEELKKLPGFRYPKDPDLQEAKRLLAEAGHPNGFKIKIMVEKGERVDGAVIFREQMKKIGIDAELEVLDSGPQKDRSRASDFVIDFSTGGEDPPLDVQIGKMTTGKNQFLYSNPRVDELNKRLPSATLEEQKQIAKEFMGIMDRELPYLPMPTPLQFRAWPKKAHGLTGFPISYAMNANWMDEVWLER